MVENGGFYYSQTGGEFSQKCFESFDIESDNLEDVERSLLTFLKKSEVANGNAKREAENYLQLNQIQRTMEDCLPEARRLALEPPFPTLPESLVNLVRENGFVLSQEQAVEFIETAVERKPLTPPSNNPSPEQPVLDGGGLRRNMPQGTRRTLNPDNPENLFHTKIIEGHFGGTSVSNWRELIDSAMRTALQRGVPFVVLNGIANLRESNPRDKSFHQIEGTHLWLQGMDSNQSWRRSLTLARKVGVDLKVIFFWRENEGAARPGEEGLLLWSPAH